MFSSSFSLSRADWLVNVEDNSHILLGLNWDSPTLVVQDVPKAIQFYEKVFGFLPVFILPDENNDVTFARMRYRGTHFTLTREPEATHHLPSLCTFETNASTPFYLYVDHVDKVYAKAIDNGCYSIESPRIDFLGDHKARLTDIFGYIWDIAAKI